MPIQKGTFKGFLLLQNIIFISLLSSAVFAQEANEFQLQQMKEFNSYKKTQEDDFKAYQKAQQEAYKNYKKELSAFWDQPKLSTKKTWVEYTKDKKTRTDVDFANNTVTVETIASSEEEAKQKLKMALAYAVTVDTKTAQQRDELEKRLQRINKPSNLVTSKINAEPILSTVIFSKEPTKKSVREYVQKHIRKHKIKTKRSEKLKNAKIYSVTVKLPSDTMIKRSKLYVNEVRKNASKQKLPVALIFAIMHTESSFNPRARSHIPAYGLMQIVPKTAGVDTYLYLYKKKKLVSGTYLYNSSNNIKMGSAYLHILYYRYLKKIKDPSSRLYCTIAAYNTGAGNIAWAFTKTYNMNRAAPIINKMTPDEVYARLLKDLRWDEPKRYLKKVSKRMGAYHKLYGT